MSREACKKYNPKKRMKKSQVEKIIKFHADGEATVQLARTWEKAENCSGAMKEVKKLRDLMLKKDTVVNLGLYLMTKEFIEKNESEEDSDEEATDDGSTVKITKVTNCRLRDGVFSFEVEWEPVWIDLKWLADVIDEDDIRLMKEQQGEEFVKKWEIDRANRRSKIPKRRRKVAVEEKEDEDFVVSEADKKYIEDLEAEYIRSLKTGEKDEDDDDNEMEKGDDEPIMLSDSESGDGEEVEVREDRLYNQSGVDDEEEEEEDGLRTRGHHSSMSPMNFDREMNRMRDDSDEESVVMRHREEERENPPQWFIINLHKQQYFENFPEMTDPLFPVLSNEAKTEIAKVKMSRKDRHEYFIRDVIDVVDLQGLLRGDAVHSSIIDEYLSLVCDSSKGTYRECFFLKSDVFIKSFRQRQTTISELGEIKREHKKLFVPVFIEPDNCWALFEVDLYSGQLNFHNYWKGRCGKTSNRMVAHMIAALEKDLPGSVFREIIPLVDDVERREDTGVNVMLIALSVCKGYGLPPEEEGCFRFARAWMTYQLIEGSINAH